MPRRPIAATRMSAVRHTPGRSRVFEWQMVTVALALVSNIAVGLPTMSLRPTTTAFCPSIGMPLRFSISMIPAGVQHALGIHRLRQRQLYQDAVDLVAPVQVVDQLEQFFGADVVLRRELLAVDS